jgi:hypothetical protein
MYDILPYSYNQAKKLGVEIKPSTMKGKKIDVYKNGIKITSIGALGYSDFPHLLQTDKNLALKRREMYRSRHKNNIGTAGFYATNILW